MTLVFLTLVFLFFPVVTSRGPQNERVAIVVGGVRVAGRAALEAASEERYAEILSGVNECDRPVLASAFYAAPRVSMEDLERYGDICRQTAPAFCSLLLHEDAAVRKAVEDMSHELQTRLQGLIARIENLKVEMK